MTKEDLFNAFFTNNANFNPKTILIIMLAAALLGGFIMLVYYITHRNGILNLDFGITLIVILLIAAVIMLMISSNIVISLGMVGALSIVRFRTAIKDSRDTVYIFWAIAEGLCTGSQNYQLAILTSICIACVLIISSLFPFHINKYIVVLRIGSRKPSQEKLNETLKKMSKSYSIRTMNVEENSGEIIVELKARRGIQLEDVNALQALEGITGVNWIEENGDLV